MEYHLLTCMSSGLRALSHTIIKRGLMHLRRGPLRSSPQGRHVPVPLSRGQCGLLRRVRLRA
jgi:hypothetical protein